MMPNATKLTILGSTVLFCQVLSAFAFGNMFAITRWDAAQNQWDTFTLPSSLCNQTSRTSEICRSYQADSQLDRSCSCQCSLENSTFAFHQNKWRCLSDSEVRQFQDCNNKASFILDERPVPVLRSLSITDGMNCAINIPFGDPSGWLSCQINLNTSWVIGCDGSRLQSAQYKNKMNDMFSFPPSPSSNHFSLEIKGDVVATHTSLLQGRILNLGIQCTNSKHNYHACLMFKAQGRQSCPTKPDQPAMTSPILTTLKSTITPTSAAEDRPAIPQTLTTTGTPIPTSPPSSTAAPTKSRTANTKSLAISPIAIPTRSITHASQTTIVADSTVTPPEGTSLPPEDKVNSNSKSGSETSSDQGSYSRGLMAGLTVAMVLVILNIIGLLVYHRRRYAKRKSSENSVENMSGMSLNQQSNPAFRWDDTGTYEVLGIMARQQSIYASMYRLPPPSLARVDPFMGESYTLQKRNNNSPENYYEEPIYHELDQFNADNGRGLQNNGFARSEQPLYGLVEELVHSRERRRPINHKVEVVNDVSKDRGVKNPADITQDQDFAQLESRPVDSKNANEPFYCVLEACSCAPTTTDTGDKEEPVYNVLEAPEYNCALGSVSK
ncbi:uncharacterized protein [Acropora muricata]|uniref:uncharacterized protein isoform X2 n=1 Tax=Acropora muricata TaxID=159855 RepID=UPI0034E5B3BE